MKYILLKVLERDTYYEYYTSNDFVFLKKMCDILNEKDDKHFYFIVEVVKV